MVPPGASNTATMFPLCKDLLVRNPVVRTECEIRAPAGPHLFTGSDGLTQRVDKHMVFGHQCRQLIGIASVDAFEKPENGLDSRHEGIILRYSQRAPARLRCYSESLLGIEPRAARAAWTV